MGSEISWERAHLLDEEAYPRSALHFANLLCQELYKPQHGPPKLSPMVFYCTGVSPGRNSTTGWTVYLGGSRVFVRMKSLGDMFLRMLWSKNARKSAKL